MRICFQCDHFCISLGEKGYSEVTPGGPGVVVCLKNHFTLDADDYLGTANVWREMQRAKTCSDFKVADWAKEHEA